MKKFKIDLTDKEILAHFPGQPILAAYKQIELIQNACENQIVGVRDVKFKSQIIPPCEIEILIDNNNFKILVDKEIKTLGKLLII